MSLIFDVKVVPNSGKLMCLIDKSGILKCFLKSLPEKGLANQELIKFLAKSANLAQNEIDIINGLSSRKKRIRINKNISYEQLLNYLNIDRQEAIKFKEGK